MKKKFSLIDHTADIGLKVYGVDEKELFVNAASGMFNLITALKKITPTISFTLSLKANSKEDLLVEWLRELLYYYNVKEMLFSSFIIEEFSPTALKAKVKGEKIDLAKHSIRTEIKAVTFHQLKIEKKKNYWQTQIIFDV
jgi:SHS2 domain-containing protein